MKTEACAPDFKTKRDRVTLLVRIINYTVAAVVVKSFVLNFFLKMIVLLSNTPVFF